MCQGGAMPTGMQSQTASMKPPTSPTPGMGNQMGGFGGQAMSGTPGSLGMPSGGVGGAGGTAGKPSAPGGQTMPMRGSGVGLGAVPPAQLGQMQQQAVQGIQPMQNLSALFNAMPAMPQSMMSSNPLAGNAQQQQFQALLSGLQNPGTPSAGLASLTPQQPGLAHYGPQGRGHQ